MKPQLTGKRPPGSEAALSLQEELAAAIHGAFEVAVEIAVQEVSKLVGQATGDVYEEMRQANESLKQRLRRAEAMLEERGGSSPPPTKLFTSNKTEQSPHSKCKQRNPDRKVGHVDPPADQSTDPRREHMIRNEEQRSCADMRTRHVSDAASHPEGNDRCAVTCDALHLEGGEEKSRVCVMMIEGINPPCQDFATPGSPALPNGDDEMTFERVVVKQEKPEEEQNGSACLAAIKVEDFTPECMLAAQSKMLEEWNPEVMDIQSHDSSTLSCSGLAQAPPTNLPLPSDLLSLSSEFPGIFQVEDPAPIPEAPQQVYGVHVRTSRNHGHTNACKHCGQTFHLPSLLRRHYSLCQQKNQQSCPQPVVGSKRAKLPLYPPGCSPFRCTVCNREFNRLENLKTHLRIHTGERPYTCSVCSKCFRHSGALTRHFRIHTGEKPYVCGQCGKSFRNCGGLKFHQRSHIKSLQ